MTDADKIRGWLDSEQTNSCPYCGSSNCEKCDNVYVTKNICRKLLDACDAVDSCNMTEHDDKTHHELLYMARTLVNKAVEECALELT